MSIVERIQQNLSDMTRSERAVASYFLGNPGDAIFFTLEKLAAATDVSTTSVIRFCRRIGFSGFKAFQDAVRTDARRLPDLPDKYRRASEVASQDGLLAETLRRDALCVEQSFEGLSKDELDRAVALLAGAKRVFTFGMRESHALAHYAFTRFTSVRPEVSVLAGPGAGEVEPLLSLNKGDLCVVFLFHRYTRTTMSLLPCIRARGASVLLITDPPTEAVAANADVILPCRVDAGAVKNSFAAPVVLTDYLCGALAFALGDGALAHMREAEALFREAGTVEQ